MKIKDIELIPLNIPQTYETHWANGRISVAEHTLVKVIAEDGTYGIGEAVPRTGIYGETQRLIQLVEDIINLSRLDEGNGYQWKTADLYQIASEVTGSLEHFAGEKDVVLCLEGEHAQLRGVPELLRGIVYNLTDNAIKYNKPGGNVTVSVTRQDASVVLAVRDTGIGIPEEDRDRIFERFYRVDKSRSKEVGGTGLGLSIVKHAVLLHKASIDVASQPGAGTCIQVRFPLQ